MGNNLTSINLDNTSALNQLFASDNQLTSLDISHITTLGSIDLDNNLLESLNIKNGRIQWFMKIAENPELQYICVDENEQNIIQTVVDDLGYTNCVVNTFCTFDPERFLM